MYLRERKIEPAVIAKFVTAAEGKSDLGLAAVFSAAAVVVGALAPANSFLWNELVSTADAAGTASCSAHSL